MAPTGCWSTATRSGCSGTRATASRARRIRRSPPASRAAPSSCERTGVPAEQARHPQRLLAAVVGRGAVDDLEAVARVEALRAGVGLGDGEAQRTDAARRRDALGDLDHVREQLAADAAVLAGGEH